MQRLGWAAWLWAGWTEAGWLWTGLLLAEWGRIAGVVLHTTQALAWLHGAEAGLRGCWAAWSGAGAGGGGAAWLLDRLGCVVAVWTTHGTGLHRAVLGCTVQGQGWLVVAVEAWAAGGGC
ncbi:hypothetical protein Acr_27g0003470 [Actinidia rufa]|uniref:Uncharacterized protein n=1 Tax=Actinidia rufa TaxID=165716 RepID=A0A7J0H6G1_9ERIC|nr:hypothetical protein Acr_27g0003470 [Actinidia rufa]